MTRWPSRRLARARQGPGGAGPSTAEHLADAVEIIASSLRAGLPPASALAIVRSSTSWGEQESARLAAVSDCLAAGGPTRQAWQGSADDGRASDLAHAYALVGQVWDLAQETGAPLSDALSHVAEHVRDESALRHRLDALAAGPRTSQRLLTLLPLVGPVLAVLVGADPLDLYLSSPLSSIAAMVGLLLTYCGWRWGARMVAGALRPRGYADLEVRPALRDGQRPLVRRG